VNRRCSLRLTGSTPFKINGIEYTWHHLEDGKTLVPVLKSVHGNPATPHIGGFSILKRDLEGLFE